MSGNQNHANPFGGGGSAPAPINPLAPFYTNAPVHILIDTDMNTDCDDVGALAVACALQQQGQCSIDAVIANSLNASTPGCAFQVMNYALGSNTIPIGLYNGPSTKPASASAYASQIATGSWGPAPTASPSSWLGHIPVARQCLANWIKAGVQGTYVAIGTQTVLSELLQSPGDAISPLTGANLFAAAVSRVVSTGGHSIIQNAAGAAEYNLGLDPVNSVYVNKNAPSSVEFVWISYELGAAWISLPTVNAASPVSEAYTLMAGSGQTHPSWDVITTLCAIMGDRGFFQPSARKISLAINNIGETTWSLAPGQHTALWTAPYLTAAVGPFISAMINSMLVNTP